MVVSLNISFYCIIAGFLIDFIPLPVISGFTSAAAITIAMGQVKVRKVQFCIECTSQYIYMSISNMCEYIQ